MSTHVQYAWPFLAPCRCPTQKAIELAVQAGLALECEVATHSVFARKNYFYPDLPKGYQISQFELPLNGPGHLDIEVDGEPKRIGITRIHVEEDAAKNIHGSGSTAVTIVDFNRGGTPLIEIVSDPDLRSSEEAEAYLRKLRDLLDVYRRQRRQPRGGFVSLRRQRVDTPRGPGGVWDARGAQEHQLVSIREESHRPRDRTSGGRAAERRDGRPGDPHLERSAGQDDFDAKQRRSARLSLFPRSGFAAGRRVQAAHRGASRCAPGAPRQPSGSGGKRELGLTEYDAGVLSGHPEIAKYFEEATRSFAEQSGAKAKAAGKKVGNFVQAEVLRHVATDGLEALFPVSPSAVAELLACVEDGTINGKIAKTVFASMVETGTGAKVIIEQRGLAQVTDTGAIEEAVRHILEASPTQVAQYKDGKTNVIGYFVGQVMKATKGAANPKAVNEILRRLLDER